MRFICFVVVVFHKIRITLYLKCVEKVVKYDYHPYLSSNDVIQKIHHKELYIYIYIFLNKKQTRCCLQKTALFILLKYVIDIDIESEEMYYVIHSRNLCNNI